jgi:hypothetical protein
MEKIKISKFTDLDGIEYEQVVIDRGNGEFTSMSKATYEAQLAANELNKL